MRLRRRREERRALAHLRDRARRATRRGRCAASGSSRRARGAGGPRATARRAPRRASRRARGRAPGSRRGARRAAAPARGSPRRSRRGRARRARRGAHASWSASVDFPTPGSPPRSTTEPGTSPPPSTRSSSATPVATRGAAVASTSRSGTAFARPPRPRPGVRVRGEEVGGRPACAGSADRLLDQLSPAHRTPGSARASAGAARRTRCRRRRFGREPWAASLRGPRGGATVDLRSRRG